MKVAILMPGDMGHGVGQHLIAMGHHVTTALDGRSAHTRMLADKAGLTDAGSIEAAIDGADLVMSILPPDRAVAQAERIAAAMQATGARPAFADCNAISPATMAKVAAAIEPTGATIIDCCIIGWNPIKAPGTRFYLSGPDCSAFMALRSEAMDVRDIGPEIGTASGLKMVFAASTKGVWTLQTALLMAAAKMGLLDTLLTEFEQSQPAQLANMRARIPFLPADAARWVPEMEEIAATLGTAGASPQFHEGAADTFRLLAQTRFAEETRETLDTSRTLEEALAEYVKHL